MLLTFFTDDCGGLDQDILIVFMYAEPSFNRTVVGTLVTTLRELTLKNSIFQIERRDRKDHKTICAGLFVVVGKTAQFSKPLVPPKGYLVKFIINGFPEDCTFWVIIRAKPYHSNEYVIVLEATMIQGQLHGTHELDFAKYGGLDGEFSLEVYKLSQETFKPTAVGQLVLTLRELSYCKSSGNSTFLIPNVYKKNGFANGPKLKEWWNLFP